MAATVATKEINFFEGIIPQSTFYTDKTKKKDKEKMMELYALAKIKIVKNAKKAVECFANREFVKFDGLVGEQACQIRALKIAMLARQEAFGDELIRFREELNKEVDEIEKLTVSKDLLMVVSLYLLTKIKDLVDCGCRFREKSNGRKLFSESKFRKLSKVKLDLFIDVLKNSVAKMSVEFVKEQAESIGITISEPSNDGKRSQQRAELPFYRMTKVVFLKAAELKIPVLLKMRSLEDPLDEFKTSLLFRADEEQEYVPAEQCVRAGESGIVIEGITTSTHEVALRIIKDFGLLTMIDANAAQHGQFTCKTTDVPKDPEREEMVEKAEKFGFSESNKSAFLIDHIYCDRLDSRTE